MVDLASTCKFDNVIGAQDCNAGGDTSDKLNDLLRSPIVLEARAHDTETINVIAALCDAAQKRLLCRGRESVPNGTCTKFTLTVRAKGTISFETVSFEIDRGETKTIRKL